MSSTLKNMVITKAVDESLIRIEELEDFAPNQCKLYMLRLDRVHPLISGNKYYKLKYNFAQAFQCGYQSVATFGGAFSNHLIATASMAHHIGLGSVGIVRGAEHEAALNDVLRQCQQMGMELHFIPRTLYAQKDQQEVKAQLLTLAPDAYWVPEGGANEEGRSGAASIMRMVPEQMTHILVSVGSGTTYIGLSRGLKKGQNLLGFAPMKRGSYLNESLGHLIDGQVAARCRITDRFHFGGFGKMDQVLQEFITSFESQYGFALDRVYTAKMMLGLKTLFAEKYFAPEDRILCIHTGGLSGN